MSVAVVLAVVASVIELLLAGAVFVSFADPERSALAVEKIPPPLRVLLLFSWSVITGIVLQLGAVGVTVR